MGRRPVNNLRRIIPIEEFKQTFKVGDLIEGYATNKIVKITAIGNEKFLYIDPEHGKTYFKYAERVSLILNTQAFWRKPT